MDQQLDRKSAAAAVTRSEVRRWNMLELEQVRHHQLGQEWVPHWHEEWSIGAVVRGMCHCSIAGSPFQPAAGDLLAIAPGTVHTGALLALDSAASVLVVMLYVPQAWFARSGLSPPPSSGCVPLPGLAQAAQHLESPAAAGSWLREAVTALGHSLPKPAPDPAPLAAPRLLPAFQSAMGEGPKSVADLARSCGISRERLHRVVKAWTGMAPNDYLRAVRMNRAREMLLAGESPAIVASVCGFADQAHFTRCHRRTFGYTPGDLLRAQSASGPPCPESEARR